MITRANYEMYFLDFYEGALDSSSKEELYAFLAEHADLRVEFESFSEVKIEPEPNVVFSGKSALHRSSVTERNYISRLVAYLEGDLDLNVKEEVEAYLTAKPGIAEELEILRKTRLHSDHSIVFLYKSSLKKGAKVISIRTAVYRTTAIAASLVLLLLSYYIFNVTNESNPVVQKKINTEEPATVESVKSNDATPAEISNSEKVPVSSDINSPSGIRLNKRKLADKKHTRPSDPASVNQIQVKIAVIIPKEQEEQFANVEYEVVEQANILEPEQSELAENTVPESISSDVRSSVFTLEELAEFEQMKIDQASSENKNVWNLAEAGVEKLGQLTGIKMELDRHHDHIANATTYALEVGKFSISRTNVK